MYNITLPILGTRLKQIREHIGYSQAQLAGNTYNKTIGKGTANNNTNKQRNKT